jgi:hypothetical protein
MTFEMRRKRWHDNQVVGVGGAGGNAVEHDPRGVQELSSSAPTRCRRAVVVEERTAAGPIKPGRRQPPGSRLTGGRRRP